MQIFEKFIPTGHINRPGTKLQELKAIVVHYTANDTPTATDTGNAKWIARKYDTREELDPKTGKNVLNHYEKGTTTKFRLGSAQVFIDCDSLTYAIPLDEVAYSCGDRQRPWESEFKGQQPLAKQLFGNQQNNKVIGIEMCNNKDWDAVVTNTVEFIRGFLKERSLKVVAHPTSILPQKLQKNEIYLLRHYDLTYKICPKPFVDSKEAWADFIKRVTA